MKLDNKGEGKVQVIYLVVNLFNIEDNVETYLDTCKLGQRGEKLGQDSRLSSVLLCCLLYLSSPAPPYRDAFLVQDGSCCLGREGGLGLWSW